MLIALPLSSDRGFFLHHFSRLYRHFVYFYNISAKLKKFRKYPIFYPLSVVTSGRVFFLSTQKTAPNSTQTWNKSQPNIEKSKEKNGEKFVGFDEEPLFTRNMLIYDGRYYLIGEAHKEFLAEKDADNDYYFHLGYSYSITRGT